MSLLNSTGDRLRRATQLWHAYLAITGQRFDLAAFLKDPALETQALDSALASGDQKLIGLAQDWLRDTGQAVPAVVASRVVQPAGVASATPAAAPAADAAKPSRYLRGVR
jgi:hypothetical protein